jgi:hypothetical protein
MEGMKCAFVNQMNPRTKTFNPSSVDPAPKCTRQQLLTMEKDAELAHIYFHLLFNHNHPILVAGMEPEIACWYIMRYDIKHPRIFNKGDVYEVKRNNVTQLWIEDITQWFASQPSKWKIIHNNQQRLLAEALMSYTDMQWYS